MRGWGAAAKFLDIKDGSGLLQILCKPNMREKEAKAKWYQKVLMTAEAVMPNLVIYVYSTRVSLKANF